MGYTLANVYNTYRDIDGRCDDEGPVTAKMGVCDVCAEDGSDPNGADPVGDMVGRLHRALV